MRVLRLSEIALLLLPLRWPSPLGASWVEGAQLPGHAVTAAGFALAVCASALIWFGLSRALPPNAPYVPAHVGSSGQIVGPR